MFLRHLIPIAITSMIIPFIAASSQTDPLPRHVHVASMETLANQAAIKPWLNTLVSVAHTLQFTPTRSRLHLSGHWLAASSYPQDSKVAIQKHVSVYNSFTSSTFTSQQLDMLVHQLRKELTLRVDGFQLDARFRHTKDHSESSMYDVTIQVKNKQGDACEIHAAFTLVSPPPSTPGKQENASRYQPKWLELNYIV